MAWHPIQGTLLILLVASSYGNRVKLRKCRPRRAEVSLDLFGEVICESEVV